MQPYGAAAQQKEAREDSVGDPAMKPDTSAIRRDLELMTARWGELDSPAVFEIRAFKEGAQPQTAKFSPDWMDDAVDWVASMNALKFNIYAVRNPIRHDITGSASDKDILAAFYLWADCDDPASAGNVYRFDGPKWNAAVTTGQTPSIRVHVYWELQEPCTDLDEWRGMQETIAAHFGSDRTVVNPSRIMRVGGTVSYPAKRKTERGYINELTTIRTEYDDDRAPVTLGQMRRVFGAVNGGVSNTPLASTDWIDTGPQSLDRDRAKIQALSGQEWHNAVIRLVGSYVSKGLSDGEIHALTDPLTLSGYTVEQTRKEVQTAIDGARRKGWTPQEYAAPAFQVPEQPQAPQTPQPSLEWFDDIEPALTDSYLIKGVLGCGAMSVVYGPSNSGKTFFALDLAYHLAIGAQWRGRRVKAAAVLYLAAEGGQGVRNRIAALRATHGVCDVPLALRRAGLDLLHKEADLQHVFDLAKEVQAKAPGAPLLIVIDTLSRIMAGGDENSAADMTALIRNIDAIREATGAHIMLVHHTGKDTARGARGHSSLRAATDTEIEVGVTGEEDEQHRAAMVTKQRDYQGGETFAFTLKSVELGHDQDGDKVTSCIVESADAEEFKAAKKAKVGRGKNQKIIMQTFDQMLGEGLGRPNPGGVGFPETGQFWVVDMPELRRLAEGKMVGNDTGRLFRQAWEALTGENALFCLADNLAWRIDRRKK